MGSVTIEHAVNPETSVHNAYETPTIPIPSTPPGQLFSEQIKGFGKKYNVFVASLHTYAFLSEEEIDTPQHVIEEGLRYEMKHEKSGPTRTFLTQPPRERSMHGGGIVVYQALMRGIQLEGGDVTEHIDRLGKEIRAFEAARVSPKSPPVEMPEEPGFTQRDDLGVQLSERSQRQRDIVFYMRSLGASSSAICEISNIPFARTRQLIHEFLRDGLLEPLSSNTHPNEEAQKKFVLACKKWKDTHPGDKLALAEYVKVNGLDFANLTSHVNSLP